MRLEYGTMGVAWSLAVAAVLWSGSGAAPLGGSPGHVAGRDRTPVIVELFTSEGCADCPAADALLGTLIATQPVDGAEIIGLGEHVDYWDRFGWKDRFSSAALTDRQQAYGRAFALESIYTPQMVVDGRAELVGSDEAAARRAIGRAASATHGQVAIEADAFHVTVGLRDLPPIRKDDRADLVVVVTEDNLRTDVKRGENKGRSLIHAAVVRYMAPLGQLEPGAPFTSRIDLPLDSGWQRAHLKVIAFVQERRSRAIIAAAAAPLGPPRP